MFIKLLPVPSNDVLIVFVEHRTLQLEFKYLSEITGDPKYWNRVERVMDVIRDQPKHDGLVPILMS